MSDPTIVSVSTQDKSPDLVSMILGPVVRHGLTTAAGALVADGVIKDSDTQMYVGAGMAIAGLVWSWWQKRGQKLAVDELQTTVKKLSSLLHGKVAGIAPSKAGGPLT